MLPTFNSLKLRAPFIKLRSVACAFTLTIDLDGFHAFHLFEKDDLSLLSNAGFRGTR